ncbi:MAG: FliM/FliN family flagellar motor switch protein [Pseudomonadota bacterium]
MSEEDIQDEAVDESANDEGAAEEGAGEENNDQDSVGEPVLSDEEKDALLDGIATGEVEVHSTSGPRYAEVADFVISPRSHIVTNGYPRLDLLNNQMATQLSKTAEKLLNVPVRVTPGSIEDIDFGELEERDSGAALVVDFKPTPLEGLGFVYYDAGVVAQLVECFFGGRSEEPTTQNSGFFTAGERAVVQKFTQQLLVCLAEVWNKLSPIEPEQGELHLNTDPIDGVEKSTKALCCCFDMRINEADRSFQMVLPHATVRPLIPAFRDQKRDADPVQDAHWKSTIGSKVTDSVIGIASEVGRTRMLLREVAELEVGDIVEIDDPRKCTLFARGVPVLEGQFGVHDGCYAIEATRWITESENTQETP